ncbi:MAG TPA: phosphatidate cytidylyltransferase [Acidobacteriota bacterium]|nr:phosphatidate cytidylyltransferase [Acidobacteriota bacterium]
MLIRFTVAAALILATVLAVELTSTAGFLATLSLLAVISAHELGRMLRAYSFSFFPSTYLWCAVLPWMWVYGRGWMPEVVLAALLLTLVFGVASLRNIEVGFPSISCNWLAVLYLGMPLCILAHYREVSRWEIWLVLLTIWAGDSMALMAGRCWGSIKITPIISPKKTLQGYLGGMSASLAAALILGWMWFPARSLWFWAAAGLTVGFFGIMGDLFESVIKRGAHIKDSSHLLPGHGGLLDRIDSTLFAFPAYYLLSRLVE